MSFDLIVLLQFATPLAFAAIGETVAQRSGVINIGIEGIMLLGAFFGVLGTILTGSLLVGFGCAIAVSMIFALLIGWFCIKLKTDQIVTGTAVTLLCLGLTSTLYRLQFGQTGKSISISPTPVEWLGIDAGVWLCLLSVLVVWLLLDKSKWGLAVKACGNYPDSVVASGFSLTKLRMQALLIGCVLAGMGGAYLSVILVRSFNENMIAGRGFVALAMVTFGRWKPIWVFLTCLLMGYLESLQFTFQTKGWDLPHQLFVALPYIIALMVLIFAGKGTYAPAKLGQPYEDRG